MTSITCPRCGTRIAPPPAEVLSYRGLTLDVPVYRLEFRQHGVVTLSPNMARLLAQLMRHPERPCSIHDLMTVNDQWSVEPHVLAVMVYKFRRLFERACADAWIANVRSYGYELVPAPYERRTAFPGAAAHHYVG